MGMIKTMITKFQLDEYKRKNISDANINELKDISTVVIDKDKSVEERIYSFIEQIGNPYLFKVGKMPVKVNFSQKATTIQGCLENLFTKNI